MSFRFSPCRRWLGMLACFPAASAMCGRLRLAVLGVVEKNIANWQRIGQEIFCQMSILKLTHCKKNTQKDLMQRFFGYKAVESRLKTAVARFIYQVK